MAVTIPKDELVNVEPGDIIERRGNPRLVYSIIETVTNPRKVTISTKLLKPHTTIETFQDLSEEYRQEIRDGMTEEQEEKLDEVLSKFEDVEPVRY